MRLNSATMASCHSTWVSVCRPRSRHIVSSSRTQVIAGAASSRRASRTWSTAYSRNARLERPMLLVYARRMEKLLPTTMVGSYPRPAWFRYQLEGRDIREAFKVIYHHEAYVDA